MNIILSDLTPDGKRGIVGRLPCRVEVDNPLLAGVPAFPFALHPMSVALDEGPPAAGVGARTGRIR